jgi:inorganic pyrophosphatase
VVGARGAQVVMPEARVELARGCPRRILSPLRLPFRHSGRRGGKVPAAAGGNNGAAARKRRVAKPITFPRGAAGAPNRAHSREAPVAPARQFFHPWHDIATGRGVPEVVTAVIEIPTNERNKYELDKESGMFRLDRVLHSAVHYPGDYGFLPRTLGDDGDPLDILVLMTIPVFTGCLVDARPIGLFHLIDHGQADEKVLAVPVGDPYSEGLHDLGDIQPHYLREIQHFFQVYKDLEGKDTEVHGFEGAAAAKAAIHRSMRMYEEKFGAA